MSDDTTAGVNLYQVMLSRHVRLLTAKLVALYELDEPLADDATGAEMSAWSTRQRIGQLTVKLIDALLAMLQAEEAAFAKALDRDADVLFAKDILRTWAGEILTDPDQRRAWLL